MTKVDQSIILRLVIKCLSTTNCLCQKTQNFHPCGLQNEQNVEVKIKNRSQIYNVCRLKKFVDPQSSKLKNETLMKKQCSEMDMEEVQLNGKIEQDNKNFNNKNNAQKEFLLNFYRNLSNSIVLG